MTRYRAYYRSPRASDARAKGLFEFDSDARAGSRENMHDARLEMLHLYGKDAISWAITKVEKKSSRGSSVDGQLELDFRPIEKKKRNR
ncbi:MAG: hypothetical protein ACOYCA_03295 [Eggerthellaceae bacterium]|jgi:hypothetical protein